MYEEMVQRVLRKCMFLLLCLFLGGATAHATRVYADLSKGQATSETATWDVETNTFTWTTPHNAGVIFSDLPTDWSGYEKLVLDIEMFQDESWRLDVYSGGQWITVASYYSVSDQKVINLSETAVLTPEVLANVEQVRVNTNCDSGHVVLHDMYLEKPFELTFDNEGKAYIYPSDMVVEGAEFDYQTGVITKPEAGNGKITIDFGDVDFSNVTNVRLDYDASEESGYTQLLWRGFIYDVEGTAVHPGGWYTSLTNPNGIGYIDYQSKSAHVADMVMEFSGEATGSMKINSICITKNVVNASAGNEICLKDLPFYVEGTDGTFTPTGTPAWNMNVETNEAIYGATSNFEACNCYVDLNAYAEIHVYQTSGDNVLRFFFFNADNSTAVAVYPTIVEGLDYSVIDLADVKAEFGKAYLAGAKPAAAWQSEGRGEGPVTIANITVTDPNAACDYVLSGMGDLNANAQAALADANATLIDARGITEPMKLVSANPNCLFLVENASALLNTKNVVEEIVTGMGTTYACENLELQAGYPFRTPYAFTATQASTAKTVSEFGTLVLPYAVATLPEGCKAYQLTGVEDGQVTGEPLHAIGANSPVLLVGEGDCAFEASNVEVAATPAEASLGALTGVYARTTAPRGSYVLQNQPEVAGMAFYHVESDAVRVNPFTAYLTDAVANAANQNALAIDLNGGVTAVDGVEAAADATVVAIYDLSGRQLDRMAKGVNVVKLSDGTVKKVIVK